jgi:hypothetical protein
LHDVECGNANEIISVVTTKLLFLKNVSTMNTQCAAVHCSIVTKMAPVKRVTARDLSGHRARRRVADSRGPVLVAGLSLKK